MRSFQRLATTAVILLLLDHSFSGDGAVDGDAARATARTDLVPSQFDYTEVLQKALFFFDAQRSGKLPKDLRIEWRGDSALEDGKEAGIDLTGGYYDSGDHMKFALPMASTLTLLAWGGIEYGAGYQRAAQWAHLLDVIRWGTDWMMKAHASESVFYGQVGDPSLDHSFWDLQSDDNEASRFQTRCEEPRL
jgi:Glycosyl hydrolase family 9